MPTILASSPTSSPPLSSIFGGSATACSDVELQAVPSSAHREPASASSFLGQTVTVGDDSSLKAQEFLRSMQKTFAWITHTTESDAGATEFRAWAHWPAAERSAMDEAAAHLADKASPTVDFTVLLQEVNDLIEEHLSLSGRPLLRTPLIAALDARSPSAFTVPVPGTQDHLILVDSDLIILTWQMCKILATVVDGEIASSGVTDEEVHERFFSRLSSGQRQAHQGLWEVALSRVLYGAASVARPFPLSSPEKLALAAIFHQGILLFILAHEYAHLILHRVGGAARGKIRLGGQLTLEQVIWSWQQELEADWLGSQISLELLHRRGYSRTLAFGLPDFYFTCLNIIDALRDWVTDDAAVASAILGPDDTHPPALVRREYLVDRAARLLRENFPAPAALEREEEMLRFARRSSTMWDTLWQLCVESTQHSPEELRAILERTEGVIEND